MKVRTQETYLKGTPICRGIAIGKPFFFTFVEDEVPEFSIASHDIESEIVRYRKALEHTAQDIYKLHRQMEKEQILEGAAILEAHLQLMQDPIMTTGVEKEIRKSRKNAEYVFHSFVRTFQNKFNSIKDPFFRERFKDIQDISRRIMSYLRQSVRATLADILPGSIIFAHELTASDAAEANSSWVGAFVTEQGGPTSHAAIVAKAKGIPYVSNVDLESLAFDKCSMMIVDGRTGDIIINPSQQTIERYQELKEQLQSQMTKLEEYSVLCSETFDGYKVRLSANVEMANELEMLHQFGGNGVGLFRSEYVFLASNRFPTEEEQFEIYKRVVNKMKGLPIVFRTFDVGGDKCVLGTQALREENPLMGCRAIRFFLRERNIFKAQLRAILRASVYGDVSIMFPMVSALSELVEAKKMVKEVQAELEKEGIPIAKHHRIGCMIEVPSAAIISDLLAKECDFLSIGTNDLVQYSLAVDRGNHAMSFLYAPTHPSVIRMIKLIVSEANHQGIPVTVCGEIAADPRFTPLLLGLGVHELSVASRYIPIVKNAIRNTSIVVAHDLAERALSLSTAFEIQELLNEEYKKNVPDDAFYNC